MSRILVFAVDSVGRDFIHFLSEKNRHRTVFKTGIHCSLKYRLNLFGLCGSRDIPVVRNASED